MLLDAMNAAAKQINANRFMINPSAVLSDFCLLPSWCRKRIAMLSAKLFQVPPVLIEYFFVRPILREILHLARIVLHVDERFLADRSQQHALAFEFSPTMR